MLPQNIQSLVTVNQMKLYVELYCSYPDKPTVVFLHDSLGCAQLWRSFPQQLAALLECNVLLYDRLGYGKSAPMVSAVRSTNYMELEADVLEQLLDQLGLTNVILFGHSDGGTIALLMASKYPQRVQAVVCEAGHIFVEDTTLKGIYEAIEAYKNTNLAQRLAKYHGDKVAVLFEAWTATWISDAYRSWNIEYCLPAITCPLLFVQGEADEYGTLAQVTKTITQVGGTAEQFILPNIGHTPHKEATEATLQAVVGFIQPLLL